MSEATLPPELGSSTLQEHVEAVQDDLRKMRAYAESNPVMTAGIAFVAGILLSALVRR